MSNIQGIRNLKELYNYKFSDKIEDKAVQQQAKPSTGGGYNSARSKLPNFMSSQIKAKLQGASSGISTQKKNLNSSKPNSRNSSISAENSSSSSQGGVIANSNTGTIKNNVAASLNQFNGAQIGYNSGQVSGNPQSSNNSNNVTNNNSINVGSFVNNSSLSSNSMVYNQGQSMFGISKSPQIEKTKVPSLHLPSSSLQFGSLQKSLIGGNSSFQSPVPSPHSQQPSSQVTSRSSRREYNHSAHQSPAPLSLQQGFQNVQASQILQQQQHQQLLLQQQQIQWQGVNQQLMQQPSVNIGSNTNQISNAPFTGSLGNPAVASVNGSGVFAVGQKNNQNRNSSRNERSTDKSDPLKEAQQQPGNQFQQFSQSQQQSLIEKYKGTPFLNYVFLNNFHSNDQPQPQIKNVPKDESQENESKGSDRLKQTSKQDLSPKYQNPVAELKDVLNFGSMTRNQFNFHYVVGKGGFGKVWKVDSKKTRKVYAMKEMSKSNFMVNMNFAFQDRDNLYLGMDLLTGGDLRFHIGKHRRFSEVQTRFFIACMMMCLEYLHINNIIHRDIKPENLVLDDKGYVRVTDLGIARVWKPENSQDTSGTPGYMAPEVMCRQNHGIAVDYFAVGVIGYEFMMGRRPYLGRSRKEIRDQILSKQMQIKKHEIPDGWSIEAADFVNRMIQRKPMNRLGINGPEEVKNHPWLKNFPWQKLQNSEIESPFIPISIEANNDYRQQISLEDKDTNEDLNQQNGLLLRRNSVQSLFSGYNFDGYQPQNQQQQAKRQNSNGNKTGSTAATHSTYNTNSDGSNSAMQQYLVNNNVGNPYTNINSSRLMMQSNSKQLEE